MRSIAFWAAIVVLNVQRLLGDEFFETNYERWPNHLVPVHSSTYPQIGNYNGLLAKHLFVTEGELGRMLVRPSFSPEFCLAVDIEDPNKEREVSASPESPSQKTNQKDCYRITVTAAVKCIWMAQIKAAEEGKPLQVQVERANRKISRDLAVAIQRVWVKALLLTSYPVNVPPQHIYIGRTCDGTAYLFSAFSHGAGTLEGETHSPERGLPLELANIGLDLAAFARQDAKGKTLTEKDLIDKLRNLESTIPQR